MLQRFLPLLLMTFFICLFILLMQFLWRYMDEVVGKGLPISIVAELMFYALLSMVPTALPLAVLLAALMTFGNLGEKFELTALKAAGISLFTIMKPLVVFMVFLSIGAFFFQNNVLPIAQTKMWALLFSIRQKSPEIDIPTRSFYFEIPQINLYVESKNADTGILYDMIIYDFTEGQDKQRVILADSGKLSFTEDKTHLFLHLYNGEMFENQPQSALGSGTRNYMPFRRESFTDKQVYFVFDANLNRMDEEGIRKQYVGLNVAQLRVAIDSLQLIVDSIGDGYAQDLKIQRYAQAPAYERVYTDSSTVLVPVKPVAMDRPLDIDSIFNAPTPTLARSYITQGLNRARSARDNYEFRAQFLTDQARLMHRHDIEMQKRFTLSFACLIFFFIGAPLGAIIKKGGIGTPLVISVFLFIFYYIIDNTGYKLARDGKWYVWQGIWLSSAVLLPMGIFFTYKAIGDSAVFNIDSYINFLNRLRGRVPKRSLEPKEVIMTEVETPRAIELLQQFISDAQTLEDRHHQGSRLGRLLNRLLGRPPLTGLQDQLNTLIDYLSNSRVNKVIGLLNEYPFELNYRRLPDVIRNSMLLLNLFDPSYEVPPADHSGKQRPGWLHKPSSMFGRSGRRRPSSQSKPDQEITNKGTNPQ